jgi:GTPase
MVGLNPDYLLCTVDANRGEMRGMVHEHLVVAHALAIPTIICLTKCDMSSEDQLNSALLDVKQFMKKLGSRTLVVKDANDAVLAAERILQGYSPIFICSAVTGAMVPELKLLLNVLSSRPLFKENDESAETAQPALQIQIDEFFPQVPGVGLVIAGRILHGTARPGDAVRIGPMVDAAGELIKDGFVNLRISSIRVQDHPVEQLRAGSSGTFALRASGKAKDALTLRALSRSRLLVGTKSILTPTRWMKASVTVLQHPSSIRKNYEPVLHVGMIRQTARVISMTDTEGKPVDLLRAGDSAEVLFRWAHWPEIVEPGCALVFRENSVKGIGTVTWVGDLDEPKRRSEKRDGRDGREGREGRRKAKAKRAKASKTRTWGEEGKDSDKKLRKGIARDRSRKSKRSRS